MIATARKWANPAAVMGTRFLARFAPAILLVAAPARATIVTNPPMPITERVTVQIIRVSDDAGMSTAPAFGGAGQQAEIFSTVDTIWAQAGIDVAFSTSFTPWNDTFALRGIEGDNDPRPDFDLDEIVTNAEADGVLADDPLTINVFLVQIVPGFSQTSNNTSNGLAFLDANGITLWAGPNLTGFLDGRDAIASVLAHEIGHNLGLDHLEETENLMQSGGSGERLNAAQISTALASPFTVAIPEPATLVWIGLGWLLLAGLRRKSSPHLCR
jgi:hypothetical protein